MRIVIDMQCAQTESRFRGIGRYTSTFARCRPQQGCPVLEIDVMVGATAVGLN
jgi:hypothetical protein